ncbi:MAG: hypothetical protein MI923_28910 [Phycisphaerales bacterium]|nr:hypothetical protein [Phycisphaerales bacterium]
MNALPILQAFVLADHIYTDAATGKRIVAGTFGHISANEFPAQHPPSAAFVMLTEFVGSAPLQLRFVRLRDNFVIMQSGEINIECDDPLVVLDMAIAIPAIPLEEPGLYCFECYVDGNLIGSVRLTAALLSAREE